MRATSKEPDRRVIRTRRALLDALLLLMAERSWDDISVQDICARADVGRSTFYLHYQGKEQLLDGGLSELRQAVQLQSKAHDDGKHGRLRFARGLIDHVFEQRKLFRSIIGRRSGHVVQRQFRQMVLQLVEEDLLRTVKASWQRDACVHLIAGAFVELLTWVAETKGRVTAGEVEDHFRQSMLPAINKLMARSP